jgi:cytochrome c553
MRRAFRCLLLCFLVSNFMLGAFASGAEPAKTNIDFSRQIRPVLAKQCFACHGPETQESGVALHQFEHATQVADSGLQPVKPGQWSQSEIIARVSSTDPSVRMPPEGAGLSESQVQLLKGWIEQGAEYREHWAFLPLTDPAPPASTTRSGNAIDAFIRQRLQERSLTQSPRANSRALIRRLYFDCIGVPPDSDTVERFAANPSDQAYGALVDSLLADARFGERMARDWLDVVRYAETNSFERDGPKPNAWKYRDYVIRSFNQDKPYDQFLREQLAGDELDQPTKETLTATGFYRLGIWDDEPADPAKAMYDEYDDLVTTIGQGMLALTLNCARCHDHKIDPIPQKDYYQMVAFLRDVTSYGTRSDESTNNQIDVSDEAVAAKRTAFKKSIEAMLTRSRELEETGFTTMDAEDKLAASSPDRNKVIAEKLQKHLSEDQWAEYSNLKTQVDKTRKESKALPTDFRLGLAKCNPSPVQTFVLMRGSPEAQGDSVEPAFPALYRDPPPKLHAGNTDNHPKSKTAGRRTELAKWMTAPANRLTGRVIANRLWQHHFGRGIVRSANNFGQLGDPPTHPELLDYLAQQLVRFDWQLKPMHRLMLMSDTYRCSTAGDAACVETDPNNDYFGRFNVRRLSAEELRDSVLFVNERIDWKQSGPSFFPDVSDDVKAGQSQPGKGWENSSDGDKSRRSIYIHIKRSLIPPELSVFDFPETDSSCEARFLTTQAAQAMNMLNGAFMQEQASQFANLCSKDGGDVKDLVATAIRRAYSRPATESEIERASARIRSLEAKFELTSAQAFREYCLVLLNSNEFLYLD